MRRHVAPGKAVPLQPEAGRLHLEGQDIVQAGSRWDVREARRVGIRRVFQELSLCDNLTLAENMHIASPLPGRHWRRDAAALLMAQLDLIFPGHGLKPHQLAGDVPIGKRQMVEIARAFVDADHPLRLMILDEPTTPAAPTSCWRTSAALWHRAAAAF